MKEPKAAAKDVRIGRRRMDSFHFHQSLQRGALPTRLAVRDSREDFGEQGLDIFHLGLGGLAALVTPLKCRKSINHLPKSTYGPGERSKEYEPTQSFRVDTGEDTEASGCQILVASKSDAFESTKGGRGQCAL